MDGAALVMRAVAEGGTSSAAPMREAALGEGAMLHHLAIAIGGKARLQPQLTTLPRCLRAQLKAAACRRTAVLHGEPNQRGITAEVIVV